MPPSPPAPKHRHAVVSPTQGSGAASLIAKAIVSPPPKVKTNIMILSWSQPTNDTINKLFVVWDTSRQRAMTQYSDILASADLRNWTLATTTNRPPVRMVSTNRFAYYRSRCYLQ